MKREIEELIVTHNKTTPVNEQMRFEAALQMLIHRVSRDMKKKDAIEEAVKMADELIEELKRTMK